MRGATRATAGSQKCPSSASSQPRRGTTSESRKATKSVSQAASPVLRAAAGPLLVGVPKHPDVAVRAREVVRSTGCRRAVVDHHDPHAAQRLDQAVEPKGVVPHRDHDGHVAVRRPARRPRVRDGRVEQGAGQLRALRVVHLEPAAAQHRLRGGRQAQQPGGRSAEERRALAEHPDPSVHLHGEAIGQPRSRHSATPRPRVPTPRCGWRSRRPSQQRYATLRRPVAVVGSPSTPTGLTAATPPRRIRGISSDSGARVARHPLVGPHHSGEICSNTDVSVCPAWASAPATLQAHHATSRPSARSSADGRSNRRDVAAMAVDEDQPRAQSQPTGRTRAAKLQRSRADRDRAGESLVLAAGAVADRRCEQPVAGRVARRLPRQRRSRSGCRCRPAGVAHAARSNPTG